MTDNLDIEILNVQNNPEGKLRQPSPQTETLVDIEKGIFVNLGIPETNGAIIVPNKPHVLIVDELRITDEKHKEDPLLIKDTAVLMGHGVRDNEDQWKFTEGQRVVDTIDGYNKYAKKEGLPEIEFLAVCNKDKITEETGVAISEEGISRSIAYAAGTEVNVSGIIEPDGKTKVYVKSKENMFNLDVLETSKSINILE